MNADQARKEIETMFGPAEELDPELKLWSYTDDSLGFTIKHPLVFSIIHHDALNHRMNKALRVKKEMRDSYSAEQNWHSYVFIHERAYRLWAFMKISDEITDDCAYWDLLGDIWTDTENAYQAYEDWEWMLSSERPCRESMMSEEEQKFLVGLPDEIEIYRGYNAQADEEPHGGLDGFSWTLDRQKAEWFAERFSSHRGQAFVATALVSKEDVIAYFNDRNESEIIVLPEHVKIQDTREL